MKYRFKFCTKFVFMFCISTFFTITLSMIVIGGCMGFLMHHGYSILPKSMMVLLGLALLSIILSTVISCFVGKKVFAPLNEVNRGAKEVARGNFNISLREDYMIHEVQELSRNFNIMVGELKSADIIHNDFTRNVSHEFKTPLSAIEGYATLLQNKQLEPSKRSFYADKIIENTKRLTNLTGNILALSQLENKQIQLERHNYPLDEQLRQVILLFEEKWTEKNLDIDVDLPETIYYGSEDLLFQVWQNIIGNGVKFAPDYGTLRVSIKSLEDTISVAISDNGCGIEPSELSRIFDKFYQCDSTHSKEGNGLGLALAKQIVDLHQGTISAESEINKGTTFTVKLPKIKNG